MKGRPLLKWEGAEDQDWEDLVRELTEFINQHNPGGRWHCELENFGWRCQNGASDFAATNGLELLGNVLPNTPCVLTIYRYGRRGLLIDNAHHDKPQGGETYTITPRRKT